MVLIFRETQESLFDFLHLLILLQESGVSVYCLEAFAGRKFGGTVEKRGEKGGGGVFMERFFII